MTSKRIHNTEPVTELIGRWHPADLVFLVALEIKFSPTTSILRLNTLWQSRDKHRSWPNADGGFYRVTLRFDGVRDFRFEGVGTSLQQLMGFEITDISQRGLEAINFDVGDYEGDVIRFFCNRVTVEEVDDTPVYLEMLDVS